jgi:P27 family predicted phage terminase small subunit
MQKSKKRGDSMAIRGRKPKPTNLKILNGNPGKRPINKNEPKPSPIAPKCPQWLTPEAKREWKRIVPDLERLGLLTVVDRVALAGYCQAYARWREAEEFITKHGSIFKTPSGYIQQVPQVSIAQKNLLIVKGFCAEFGLTPSARSRINVNTDDGTKGDSLLSG